ncbi:MAG TPA: riboflavin synthase [Syntrophales bacterium]|nr:riboflavin synthase [Syntrophales bacterium]
MKEAMFTGIVQALGTVRRINRKGEDAIVEIEGGLDLDDVRLGDSVAVNGTCLTVTAIGRDRFSADVSAESLAKTNLKALHVGDKVNLEKALRLTDFLGGHLVLGHVDETGIIREKTVKSSSVILGIEVSPHAGRYIVVKGSITVDGVSLTVNRFENGRFYVNMIPHTAQVTTLGLRKVADAVNIETDIIGKYVERFVRPGGGHENSGRSGFDWSSFVEHGFLK